MELSKYDNKLIRITDRWDDTFVGFAETFPSGYGLHEFGREEESIKMPGNYYIFEGDIKKIEELTTYEEAVETIPPGRYRHFKGNEYEVIGIARHSETTEPMVVYRALYGDGGIWVRPAYMSVAFIACSCVYRALFDDLTRFLTI